MSGLISYSYLKARTNHSFGFFNLNFRFENGPATERRLEAAAEDGLSRAEGGVVHRDSVTMQR